MKLTSLLLTLMLLATPVWAEDKPCEKECKNVLSYSLRMACIQLCEICEIKEILKELVKR